MLFSFDRVNVITIFV